MINLSEVLVAREAIAAPGVTSNSPTEAVGVDAARMRGPHPISVPDASLLATARQSGSTLVTFDRKVMRAAAAEGIPVAGQE